MRNMTAFEPAALDSSNQTSAKPNLSTSSDLFKAHHSHIQNIRSNMNPRCLPGFTTTPPLSQSAINSSGETMSVETQRVVVIQDASKDISSSVVNWAIDGLSLKPGDELTLLGVLHQVNTPSTFPIIGAAKLMGYKTKVDHNSMLGANQKIIHEEVMKKEFEYQNSTEILEISKLYEIKQIAFNRRVVAAPSPKVAALEAAKSLRATWIILDRQMKKDKKYFMDRLACGISRMKRNNSVELLRGPKAHQNNGEQTRGNQSSYVKPNEMLTGQEVKREATQVLYETLDDDDLFSLEVFPRNLKSNNKNYLDDEMEMDDRIEAPEASSVTTFSTSPSYDTVPLLSTISTSAQTNNEFLPHSSFNEVGCQQDGSPSIEKAAEDDGSSLFIPNDHKIKYEEINETMVQETEHKQHNAAGAELTNVNRQLREVENIVCSHCGNERPKIEMTKYFAYDELHAATNGFSQDNFLSEGGFGSVYKGRLKDGHLIAVKQHKHASLQGEKEFRSESHVLSKARHNNVVMLLGSCSEGSHRLLVYEYICNGSLDIYLSKNSPHVLSWKNRMNIALGVAQGLNYLHQNNIIHRDMRPNNILLNHDYQPLLGDFGLAKAPHTGSDYLSEDKVVGTIGYMAPEYAERGKVSSKIDVYSFGVILLELITGRTTMDRTLGQKSLVGWARPLLKEKKYPELIDERILDFHDVHELFWMVRLAEMCLQKDPDNRPSMEKVEGKLKSIINGDNVARLVELSPIHSDSSLQKSNESDNERETDLQEWSSTDISSNSRSQMAEQLPISLRLPPSKSLSAHFEDSSSTKIRPKKKEKSRSTLILYDEMLD